MSQPLKEQLSPHDFLIRASQLVNGPRSQTHGDYRDQHQKCAALWSAYLGQPITAEDVALMLALMKVSRMRMGSYNRDHYDDAAAYIGIAGALAQDG
ncbi:MAG TPA: DUF6378 domain-containing protein [Salinarimonas sp.]|nr:DUF6378 domain-containing protein [Salinarimonas sp.]